MISKECKRIKAKAAEASRITSGVPNMDRIESSDKAI